MLKDFLLDKNWNKRNHQKFLLFFFLAWILAGIEKKTEGMTEGPVNVCFVPSMSLNTLICWVLVNNLARLGLAWPGWLGCQVDQVVFSVCFAQIGHRPNNSNLAIIPTSQPGDNSNLANILPNIGKIFDQIFGKISSPFAIRYLTHNFWRPVRFRYWVSLFGRAATVHSTR